MDIKIDKITIYVNLIAYPLYTLGPSTRVGLWVQGCSLNCSGCISKHTWKISEKYKMDLSNVIEQLKDTKSRNLTISGGEPFEQADVLYLLLKNIRKDFDDILIYSGYTFEYLKENYQYILELIDVLVDGNFIKSLPSNKSYKGSKNQRMFIFNENLTYKYKQFFLQKKGHLQIYKSFNKFYFLGIPTKNEYNLLIGVLDE